MNNFQTGSIAANRRRSERVAARIAVKVIRNDNGESEDTSTKVVSSNGALLMLSMPVRLNEELTLQNHRNLEAVRVRVIRVDGKHTLPTEVAVEFTSPVPDFWHIDFSAGH